MKKIVTISLVSLLAFIAVNSGLAQSPEQFKYQAVLRDATGNPIVNTAKTVIINILQNSATGTSVYQETHSVTTTAQGIINLNIGGGTVNSGVFANINWSANPYWVKVTVDGSMISNGQLLSVPYALNVKGINVVNGNVGIGTTTPASLLHLLNSAPRTNLTVESNSTTFGPEVRLISSATGGHEWRVVSGASASNSYGAGSFELWDQTAGASRFGILANGNVGIGTTTPAYKMDVNGTINGTSVLVNGVPVASSTTAYWVGGAGSTINYPGGNVGIGTTNPQNKLHVAGFIQLEGNPDAQVLFGTTSTGKRGIGSLAGWNPNVLYLNGWGDFTGGVSVGGNFASNLLVNGNVGIGTNNPSSLLHLFGSGPKPNIMVESDHATAGPELRLNSTGTGGHEWRIVSGASANSYGAGSFELWDQTAGASRFGILSNGNIGIGTTTPAYKVDVNGAINGTSVLVNGVPVASSTTAYWVGGAGSTINYTAGNVGIGTLTPGYKLDVNGVIHSAIDNGVCFMIGNDMTLQDINLSNHVGLYGAQDATVGSIKLGSGGGIISGKNNYIGIGTTNPSSLLHLFGSDPKPNIMVESDHATLGPEFRLKSTGTGGHEWRIVCGASANPYGAGSFELWDQTAGASRFGISATGNVGIGTTAPAAKLHVAGTVRIVDGTQGANKVLTSDASGNASWVTNTGITPAVTATLSGTAYNLTNTAGQYTGSSLTLPPGKWSVQINILLPSDASSLWVRSGFSSSSSSYISSPHVIGASLASGYKAANAFGMLIGTIIINNTSGSNTTYYYWSQNIVVYSGSLNLANFGTSLWMEDQIIAYPMN